MLDLLAGGMSVEIAVTGDSMSPAILSGDAVTLAPISGRRVGFGDVVAFPRPDGRLVIHRVVARRADRLLTRGDAASAADGWIACERLVGRVEKVSRRGRQAYLGLGPDRWLCALLSRAGLLRFVQWPTRWALRQVHKYRS